MARNVYFSNGAKNEQALYEDVIIEALKIYGHDVYYVPRTIVSLDRLLNEDTESRFDGAYKIEAYVESVDGYEGEGTLLSKFGLEMRDQLKLVISRRRWNHLVGKYVGKKVVRPQEGDLIYFPVLKGLFEIKYVNSKSPFYQLQNLPVYKLTLELFEYRGEDIDTGIEDVDNLQGKFSETTVVQVNYTSSNAFSANDNCTINFTEGGTAQSEVLKVESIFGSASVKLHLAPLRFTDGIIRTISNNSTISSVQGGATAVVIQVAPPFSSSNGIFANDPSAQNDDFELDGNSLIDFTQRNPFGEPDNTR
jgi:hypothetical protein